MNLVMVGTSPRVFQKIDAHSHDYYELIYNLEGEGTAIIGGEKTSFLPGTLHIIPPYISHEKMSDTGFRDIYLRCDRIFETNEQNDFSLKNPILLQDDEGRTLQHLFQILLFWYLQGRGKEAVAEQSFQMILELVREWCAEAPKDPLVTELIHMLLENMSDPNLKVTELLSQCGYNIDYVRRRFIRATGVSPNDYLTDLRMNYARTLLRKRKRLGLSIGEISLMCGYYDQGYFSRLFKARVGCSPSDYDSSTPAAFGNIT